MKTIKLKHIILSFIAIVLLVVGILFYTKSYYPELPIEGVSKREVIRLLEHPGGELILLKNDGLINWYGFKGNQFNGSKELIEILQSQGLVFIEQMGSGYMFTDHTGSKVIVESQMWTGKYVLYEIPH